MRAQFIKGGEQDPKAILGIGKRHRIELPSGFSMEGPYVNKSEVESLLKELDKEIEATIEECEAEEIYDDHQMDMLDDVVDEYEPKFKELGYSYTDD